MVEDAREFFESLPARATPEHTAGINHSYLFEISGSGIWLVDVRDAGVTVTEGEGEADVRIAMSEETFRKLAAGEQNPMRGVMTGKIKVRGDMGAATKLQKLLA
jgi:putative sterol carrier protein